ncbi:hypothetical protein GCM10011367_12650 [Marinicauda pacifica]|uniref:Uncharacterized protein n=1 Tax=Marinicauda pacifica TaxID=1133559 RepID=A0A4S2HFQ6_9PROT|nr:MULTISPECIES: hypothetical protein [Marinicauda]TGY94886.1 hypothetical protein E5162_06395 [Marinicauda pacifica]GGE39637.1 hypothetical protein GCM10011367_12650 [Marinicauda pacifica]
MSFVYQFIGIVLIVAGLPLFWTPIPVGAVMIATGLALLVSNSSLVRGWVIAARDAHPRFDRWMRQAQKAIPGPFSRVLSRTDPDTDSESADQSDKMR